MKALIPFFNFNLQSGFKRTFSTGSLIWAHDKFSILGELLRVFLMSVWSIGNLVKLLKEASDLWFHLIIARG